MLKTKLLAGCALACLALSLTACALPGLGANADTQKAAWAAVKDIVTDPRCGHTDEAELIFSPAPSGHVKVARNCPGPAVGVLQAGAVVGAPGTPAPAQ